MTGAAGPSPARRLRIAAAVIQDSRGRLLLVRKAGTVAFMQPGGKLEPRETAAQCLVRELGEELALDVPLAELEPLGRFAAPAANEAGWSVDAEVYRWSGLTAAAAEALAPRAELEELRWCTREELEALAASGLLAPLTRDNLGVLLG